MSTGDGPGYREGSGAGRDMGLGGSSTSVDTVPEARAVAAQLRRRREASDRLQPLADGRRDPLDPPYRKRPFAYITVDTEHELALIRGPAGIVDCLEFLGVNYGWSHRGRGWCFGAEHVPDVEAYAQWKHGFVVVSRKREDGDAA